MYVKVTARQSSHIFGDAAYTGSKRYTATDGLVEM